MAVLLDSRTGQAQEDMGNWRFGLSAVATFDVFANVSGGTDRGIDVPGSQDLVFDVEHDAGPGAAVHRGRFYLLGTTGGSFSEKRIGDVQVVSSIDAPNTVKIFEAWYELEAPGGRAALLVGLHDLSVEFDYVDRGQLQVHSSIGTGPTLSQAFPSIFPVTAAGARLRLDLGHHVEAAIAVYDGIPGDPSDPYGTHVEFADGDGLFAISQISVGDGEARRIRKLALGVWHSSAEFGDPGGRVRDGNSGFYLNGESFVPGVLEDRLGGFVQIGAARGDRNVVTGYLGAGLHLHEPVDGRADDEISLTVAHARLGGGFRRANGIGRRAETSVEFTYLLQINDWLALQPDLHVVLDPGAVPGADDAVIIGFRVVLTLD